MKLIRVQSMYTLTHMYPMYKDRHMDGGFQEVHEAHQIDQHEQKGVLDAL
jgi:hypothetical protein